jgi:O-antigen/teichoic acid export membrane protein
MKRGLAHYVGNLAPFVSGLFTAPITARALGVEGRGAVTIVVLVSSSLIAIGTFGLGWLARDGVAKDPLSISFWRGKARRSALLFLPLAVGVGIAVSAALGLSLIESSLVIVLYALAAFGSTRSVDGNCLVSIGRNGHLGLANMAYAVSVVIVMLILFFVGVLNVAWTIGANIVGVAVQLVLLRSFLNRAIVSEREAMQLMSTRLSANPEYSGMALLRKAGTAWRAQVADTLLVRADTLSLALTASSRQVGLYSVAGILPQVAYATFMTIVQSSFARAPQLPSQDRLRLIFQTCMLASVILAVLGLPAGYFLIPIVFGEPFAGARGYLLPAVSVMFGLAGMASALQDIARRPASGLWSLALFGLPLLVGVAGLVLISPQSGIALLGLGMIALATAYGARRVGRRLFSFSPGPPEVAMWSLLGFGSKRSAR